MSVKKIKRVFFWQLASCIVQILFVKQGSQENSDDIGNNIHYFEKSIFHK